MATNSTMGLNTTHWGSGARKILLIHGLSAHGGTWWRIGPILATLGYEVTAVDLRGHGQTGDGPSYALNELANDVVALHRRWDLIVGHSMGGPIATIAAIHGICDRLLLLDPFFEVADSVFEDLLADQLAELDIDDAEAIQKRHPRWHAEDCRQKAAAIGMTSGSAIERYLRDNHPFHYRELLEECTVEALILGSDPVEGSLFPPETMHQIYNPKITYRMVVGSGHSIQRSYPEHVISAARELLSTTQGSRAHS